MIWPEIAIKKAYRERLPIAFDALFVSSSSANFNLSLVSSADLISDP